MRVAVTGGSGRLGQATVRELLAHGHEVVNLDRRATAIPGAAFTAIDVLRPADVLNGLNGCEAVVTNAPRFAKSRLTCAHIGSKGITTSHLQAVVP